MLTTGSASTWAICLECDRRHGNSLSAGWRRVLTWILAPTLALLGALVLLYWLFGDGRGR